MSRVLILLSDRRGAAAAEFAMVLPGLIFLIFGIMNLCLVTYASVSLHSAVEQAARYASTQAAAAGNVDPGATAVKAYAARRYFGPGISASYAYATNGTCSSSSTGHVVSATGTFKVQYGLGSVTVPLSAQACFP